MYFLYASVFLYAFNNVLWKQFVKNEHPLHLISRRAVFTVLIALAEVWYSGVDMLAFCITRRLCMCWQDLCLAWPG